MTAFTYRARNPQGELVAGTLEMDSEVGVAANLDRLGYSVLEIKAPAAITTFAEKFQGLKKQEVIIFNRQLATLIRSGMPLLPSLSTICEQTTSKKFNAPNSF